MSIKIEIELKFARSTKGTHVYMDDTEGTPVKTLYITRTELPNKPPELINVQIEYDNQPLTDKR